MADIASKIHIESLSASTTTKRVCRANPSRKRVYVQITDSGTAYIVSAQGKPYTEGIKVTSSIPYENVTSTGELWILTSSSTAACIIEQDTD